MDKIESQKNFLFETKNSQSSSKSFPEEGKWNAAENKNVSCAIDDDDYHTDSVVQNYNDVSHIKNGNDIWIHTKMEVHRSQNHALMLIYRLNIVRTTRLYEFIRKIEVF